MNKHNRMNIYLKMWFTRRPYTEVTGSSNTYLCKLNNTGCLSSSNLAKKAWRIPGELPFFDAYYKAIRAAASGPSIHRPIRKKERKAYKSSVFFQARFWTVKDTIYSGGRSSPVMFSQTHPKTVKLIKWTILIIRIFFFLKSVLLFSNSFILLKGTIAPYNNL